MASPAPASHTSCPGQNLSGTDLSGLDLAYADLSTANLKSANARQRLAARFGRGGVLVRSGPARVSLSLGGYGYADQLRPLPPASPVAHANRVVYRHGPVSEWELPDAEQAPDWIERGSDMHVGVGIHAAGDGPCFFYDGHSHPFLRLRDGTHPLAVGPVNPRPLAQAGQIRPAPPVGAVKPGPRPTARYQDSPEAASAESEVRPGPRPLTLRPR